MPIYRLTKDLVFPHPELSEKDGLLAIGGDLSAERLLLAYSNGIFPWYNEGEPILWWSPNPRMIMFPNDFKLSKSLKQIIRSKKFTVKFDYNFKSVISNCANIERKYQDDTWITKDIIEAYTNLHKLGFAHSVEVYQNNELVGGLYGIAIGKAFFGESMFHKVSNASKLAFYYLVEFLKANNFDIIDAQQSTNHLKSLGAKEISRQDFLKIVDSAIVKDFSVEKWI